MINNQEQELRLSEFDAEYTDLFKQDALLSTQHQHHNTRKLKREPHNSEAFVVYLTMFYCNFPRQDYNNQNGLVHRRNTRTVL